MTGMTETNNTPPAGQTWDSTLRQWVPSIAVPRIIARAEYKDSSSPYTWAAASTILTVADSDGNPFFVNYGYDVSVDAYNGDRGVLLTESGLLTLGIAGTVGLNSGSAGNFTGAYLQAYLYPSSGSGVGATAETPAAGSGTALTSITTVKVAATVQAYVDRNTWLLTGGATNTKNVLFGGSVVAGSAGAAIAFKELQLILTFQPC